MFYIEKKLEFTKRKFNPDMTPQELSEVEIDNMKSGQDIADLEVTRSVPVVIDKKNGFCVEYLFPDKDGLKVQATHCGFIHDEWVCRILYEGAAQDYFNQSEQDFKKFLRNFKIIKE